MKSGGMASAVWQKVFLHGVPVGFEQHRSPAQASDLLICPFNHSVAFAHLRMKHFAGCGDFETLLGA